MPAADGLPVGNLAAKPGTPVPIATACQRAVAAAARRYSARVVEVASGGSTRSTPEGGIVAPVTIRITYGEGTNAKIRQAGISCAVDPNGRVTALS